MTVREFKEWLEKNTMDDDEIEYIDFHGSDVDDLKMQTYGNENRIRRKRSIKITGGGW